MLMRMMLLVGVLLPAWAVRAGTVDGGVVAADARWVIHLNVDAIRASRLWQIIEPRLESRADYIQFVNAAGLYAGANFPQDMHGITLYGDGFDEKAAVVVIDADVDQARLTDTLHFAANELPQKQSGRQVFNWNDEKGEHFGAFGGSRFVIANSEQAITNALDALDRPNVATSPLILDPAAVKADTLIYVAATDLKTAGAISQNPLAANMNQAWMTLSSVDEGLAAGGAVGMTNAETAKQAGDLLIGLKAFALLSADDPKHDAVARKLMSSLSGLSSGVEGNTVRLNWSIPSATVDELVKAIEAKQAGQ